THPPLAYRIRLLDPSFDGKYIPIKDDRQKPKPQYVSPYWGTGLKIPPGSPLAAVSTAAIIDSVGSPAPSHIGQSQTILNAIPADIRKTIQSPQGAACAIYSLLMHRETPSQDLQLATLNRSLILQGNTDPVVKLGQTLTGLPQGLKLPLIELAMPALSGLTSMEKRNFLLILQGLINADGKVSLLELSVQWILENALNPSEKMFGNITKFSYSQVGLDIVVLLSAIANTGNPGNRDKAQKAFDEGIARIPELAARKPVFSFEENPSFTRVNRTLKDLTSASFKIRESVIDACAHCVLADKTVTSEESELLRVIALALQCPLPPIATTA
ncbi:MAG TPA: hypothetical protein VKO67_06795, partial [Smithellaceae bacterium]|nr:hypothetical protein [Smithellaceae bacterium]